MPRFFPEKVSWERDSSSKPAKSTLLSVYYLRNKNDPLVRAKSWQERSRLLWLS